jgi:hypothetical protein
MLDEYRRQSIITLWIIISVGLMWEDKTSIRLPRPAGRCAVRRLGLGYNQLCQIVSTVSSFMV